MIRILAKKNGDLIDHLTLETLNQVNPEWYWIDISTPDEHEADIMSRYFSFLHVQSKNGHRYTKRPQMKIYSDHYSWSAQAINPSTLKAHELQLSMGDNCFFTYHVDNLKSINDVWHDCRLDEKLSSANSVWAIMQRLTDRLIEQYYMVANLLEDKIDALDMRVKKESVHRMNQRVFLIRSELLGFRRAVTPLQDIFRRMVESPYVRTSDEENIYLRNVNENLGRLTHMIEANMEITSDIRDSYLALTSYRTNSIMQTLTVITTIFMPLSFIAGVYGMNFRYMPELNWRGGYFFVLGLMLGIAISMYFWFRKKGWFDK